MKKEYNFATFYRVIGMIFILLCHFTQESSNPYLNMSAQFFNIGVNMFFILSGFLFGTQRGQSRNTVQWLKRRLKRIFIPYELFVATLFCIHLFSGKNVRRLDWLWLILGMQGSIVGIHGAEQTWFITPILLCYLVTPIFDICCTLDENRSNVIKGILIITPAILALLPPAYVSTLFSAICWYGLAYFIGNKSKFIQTSTKGTCCASLIICISFAIRLTARILIDGTILYDRIVTSYTHATAAFALFYMVEFFTKQKQMERSITFLSSISFEVYLYHYMFCVGPVRLFTLSESWLLNCCIVTFLTVVISSLMKKVSNRLVKRSLA